MRRLVLVCALFAAAGAHQVDAQRNQRFAGRPLAEALAELQADGLRIVYSTAVVSPSMVVEREPTADTPRGVLDQLLKPHGLRAEDGPGNTIVVVVAPHEGSVGGTGIIRGVVTVDGLRTQVADLVITVEGTDLPATYAVAGSFTIENVPAGSYTITADSSKYTPRSIDDVVVVSGRTTRLRVDLVPVWVFLSEVIVTPSHFRLLEREPESRQFLSRDEVARMPHVADDLYRAVQRLPGSASGDFTAKINVRGGEQDELLVILDGLELYEPFHLKDFQNVFSIIDSEAVGGVDFMTGGFPAEYGDRMSGVMDISLATPTGPATTAIELSNINARILSQGSFDSGDGQWFVSARAWYPDALVGDRGESLSNLVTDYYDLLAKVQHHVGRRSHLSADLLVAYDDLGYGEIDEEEQQEVTAEYASYYLWLNLGTEWSDHLFSQTVLSVGRLTRDRHGTDRNVVEGALAVSDRRSFEFLGLGQDWIYELDERNLLKWGFDVVRQEAVYNYESVSNLEDPTLPPVPDGPPPVINTHLEPEGSSIAVYVADRFRLIGPLVVELGLRWDHQQWIEDNQISPRFNLVYTVGPRTVARAAWGKFHQSQRLDELQVEDGVTEFHPAQLATHLMLSLEHSFTPGLTSRVEVFRKDLPNLRPRYENLFEPIQLFPESSPDRVRIAPDRGLVRGLEVVFKGTTGPALSWWASYVLARAEDRIDGTWELRSWDQKNAVTAGLNLSFDKGWSASLVGLYHTGWPTTQLFAEVVAGDDGEPEIETSYGPRNAIRYPAYARLDLRVSKLVPTDRGELTLYLEVINLTNRSNVCCTEDFHFEIEGDGSVTVIPEYRSWAPIIPTVGVGWRF